MTPRSASHPNPCPPRFNLADYVLHHGDADDDKIALAVLSTARSDRWSYGRLRAAVLGVATGLLEAGLNPGDRLLLRLPNGVGFPLAYLGAIAAGIVPVPTSAQLTAPEVDRLLPTVAPAAMALGDGVAAPTAPLRTITQSDILAMTSLPPAQPVTGDPDRLAYIVFTSGTSGTPRAVAHAHRAVWARRMMWDGWYGLTPRDRLLHAGAMNWTFTLGTGLLDPWAMGATALIPAEGTPIEALPLLMNRHDATLFAAAPGVLRKLLKTPDRLSLPKLRHTLTAGEHLQGDLAARWRDHVGPVYDAYGMTECSTFLSAAPGDVPSLTPQPGRRVQLTDDGHIAIRRDEQGLMLGYLEDGAPTLPLTGDWFVTGDLARQDGARIQYQGRSDDMMNAGGYRVSPLEVEAALTDHPAIAAVAVTDIPVAADARVIAAFYTAEAPIPEADLAAHAATRLARYKQPRIWCHVPDLPTGPNGKLQRRALRDLYPAPDIPQA
ncbi:MAG: class I adenylate-forming enzyme family protein [Pseudomonadota bacterium]